MDLRMFPPRTPHWNDVSSGNTKLASLSQSGGTRVSLASTSSWPVNLSLVTCHRLNLTDIQMNFRQTDVEVEFERLKVNHAKNSMDHVEQPVGIEDFFRASVLKALGISMGIMFFQQFTGINAIIYYTVTIFRSAGSSIQPSFAAITVGIVQLIFTISSGLFVLIFGCV